MRDQRFFTVSTEDTLSIGYVCGRALGYQTNAFVIPPQSTNLEYVGGINLT